MFGEAVSLEQGGTVYFTGTIPTPPAMQGGEGEEFADGNSAGIDLTVAAGLSEEAGAHVEAVIGLLGGAVSLEIEVENVPAGDYDVLIDGVQRATLVVVEGSGDLQGGLDFDAESSDPEKLPLTFAAAGEAIVISQGGVTFFSGVIPAGPTN